MDKAKKKNIKRIITGICAVAVVILLAAMPLIAGHEPEDDGPKASILNGTVSNGSIDTALIGGGTLAEEDAVSVQIPSEVKLTGFLVSNGDVVTEGTPIATVDRVTVMLAITEVQETLEYLSEQIEEAADADREEKITALAGGVVKIIYAEEGRSAQDVMLEHGALAVLSLDGLMAVDLEAESDLPAGSTVTVMLEDGTVTTGKVESNLVGKMIVTVEDDDYEVGTVAEVTADDGRHIGSGELYIYSPWNATAYTGTVDTIKVDVGDDMDPGDTLMVLKDVSYSASYHQLIGQRQEYEDLMFQLFQMYQAEQITAPCDGVVSGIDENSLQLLSEQGTGFVLSFLANAPNGDDETLYSNYIGQVKAVGQNGWALSMDPRNVEIADYMELSGVVPDTQTMTELVVYNPTESEAAAVPIYELENGAWVTVETAAIAEGDILLFAEDAEGSFVWILRLQKAQTQPPEMGDPNFPSDSTTPTEPGTSTDPTTPSEPGSGGMGTTTPGGSWGNMGSMGGMGSYPQIEQESAFELYGLDMAEIAAVTPQSTMSMDITIDELDISALKVGMAAQIRIDALGGEKYTAVITQIGNSGTNNGGSSKFTVTLTMDRGENMLVGMNATAKIVLSTTEAALTLPADALVEEGNQTLVYTGYDEENQILQDPVTVQVGISDGETVQILEGLSDGQTYYYAYYDTLEISYTPDFGGGFPYGFSGEGFDGTMPEGGEFSGSFPGGGNFPSGEDFSGWVQGQMPSMPEGGEMPDFSGSFGGMMGGFSSSFDEETQQIDIGDTRIGVEIEGGKESGSLENLIPGAFVTITMTAKGKVTYVLVSSSSDMNGFGGFGNFMGMGRQ